MDNECALLPALIECPFCELPVDPGNRLEEPYCSRKCFDAHVDEAVEAAMCSCCK
jgi:hypothetical protein